MIPVDGLVGMMVVTATGSGSSPGSGSGSVVLGATGMRMDTTSMVIAAMAVGMTGLGVVLVNVVDDFVMMMVDLIHVGMVIIMLDGAHGRR
jgi:hypothetical protein